MHIDLPRLGRLTLLIWLMATVSIGLQGWVGDQTIYSKQFESLRESAHFGILANEAPGGAGWAAVGGLTVEKRIGVVYLAEGIRKLTKLPVGEIYKLLDTVFLFAFLTGLLFYLRRWVPDVYCLVGVLYVSTMLPMTYFLHVFHPWDRLQLAIWIGLLHLIHARQFAALAVGLFISVLVKFDTVLIPFFYFAVHLTPRQWKKTCVESLALLLLAFGTYAALGHLYPAPLDTSAGYNLETAFSQVHKNIQTIIAMNLRFPPLLVHVLPLFLALFFLQTKARFVWASVAFGFGLSAVFFMFSNYEEVRAHMVVLVLVLPSALLTLKTLIDGEPRAA